MRLPCACKIYLQRTGDDLSGQGEYEFYRWFSNEVAYRLAAGSAHLTVALTPGQSTSVFGKRGDYDLAATAGFVQALRHLGNVGFVFGSYRRILVTEGVRRQRLELAI
jgi:hypothetical protein